MQGVEDRSARSITVGELVKRYGNPDSERLFEEEDFKMHLLNSDLEAYTY